MCIEGRGSSKKDPREKIEKRELKGENEEEEQLMMRLILCIIISFIKEKDWENKERIFSPYPIFRKSWASF